MIFFVIKGKLYLTMAKRFIDTELFNDEWYMDLSKDAKILWLYMITKCSPAGFFKMNEKLCKVQTGITDIKGASKGLQRGLQKVNAGVFFVHGFLEFQYPGFPNSKVRQQASAIRQLKEYDLWDEEKNEIIKGASKGLQRGYGIDNGNVIKKGTKEVITIPPLTEFLEQAKISCKKAKLNFNELAFAIESKYETWVGDGWKDGHGAKIKNWKNKISNTLPFLKPIKQKTETIQHGTLN